MPAMRGPSRSHRPARTLVAVGLWVSSMLIAYLPGSFAKQTPSLENSSSQDSKLSGVAGSVVRAETNEPLRKARIVLTNEEDHSVDPYIAITGSDGRFSIAHVVAGRYRLHVQRDGYVSKWYAEDASGNSFEILSLKPGQQMSDLFFRLQRCGVISGHVLDEYGDPAQGVDVKAEERSTSRGKVRTSSGGFAQTNDLGEYRIFGLRPGRYFVRAQTQEGNGQIIGKVLLNTSILTSAGGYVPTYYPGVSQISRASAIEVKPGDEITGVDLILLRGSSHKIRGVVVTAVGGHPDGNVSVEAGPRETESDSEDYRRGEVNEKTGEFEIADVRNGNYMVYAVFRDGQNEFLGSAPIDVLDADVNSVRIIITRGVEVHGRVVRDGKIAASHIDVYVNPKDRSIIGARHETKVKADGSFTISGLADGLYEFEVLSDCANCYLKSASADGADVLDSGLQISGAAISSIELVYSSKSGAVDGTVVRADGAPAANATVVLVPDPPRRDHERLYREASADQFAHFVAENVTPGKYHAFAWEKVSWDDFTDPDFLREYEPKGEAFLIGENEKKTLQLKLISDSDDKK
jgi:hypothetical protein